MITVELAGGLGNQMFQYACARALSLRLGAEMQLNTTNPDRDRLRRYALDCFPNIKVPLTKVLRGRIIEEKVPGFQPQLLVGFDAKEDVTLRGYWQSEKYFEPIAEIIRRDFLIPLSSRRDLYRRKGISDTVSAMVRDESCAIHIRRTDYITDPQSIRVMGNLPMAYYYEAMRAIESKHKDVHYFIFSDDPDWCERELRSSFGERQTLIEGNKDFEDLWLMSLCNHHIVANSSFSWWGAWLGCPCCTTVAPKKWFAQWNSEDVCPPSWLRI